jgi:acyl transferase domain-containing protein
VIYQRSRLQGSTRGLGQMTAVGLGEAQTRELLDALGLTASLTIAGINSSRGVTVAGTPQLLTRFESALAAKADRPPSGSTSTTPFTVRPWIRSKAGSARNSPDCGHTRPAFPSTRRSAVNR